MLESSISGLSAASRRARHVFPAALALVLIPSVMNPSPRLPGYLIQGPGGVLVCPKDGTKADLLPEATSWHCEHCDKEYRVPNDESQPSA
jgi:hypothetical protein